MAQETNNSKSIFINYIVWLGTGILDYLNTSAIYTGYLTPVLMQIFQQSMQFIFFPIYAINTVIYAILALNNLLLDRDNQTKKVKTENIIRLVINVASALIVGTAVIGGLAFAAAMGVATTILFALNLALTGIYNFAGMGYHIYQFIKKGRLLNNTNLTPENRKQLIEERMAHRAAAISHFAVGSTIVLIALAGGLAVLGGFLPLASIGIAAGIIGAAFCAYALVKAIQAKVNDPSTQTNNDIITNNAGDVPVIETFYSLQPTQKPNSTLMVLKNLYAGLTSRLSDFAKTFYATENPENPQIESNSQQLEVTQPLLLPKEQIPSQSLSQLSKRN